MFSEVRGIAVKTKTRAKLRKYEVNKIYSLSLKLIHKIQTSIVVNTNIKEKKSCQNRNW